MMRWKSGEKMRVGGLAWGDDAPSASRDVRPSEAKGPGRAISNLPGRCRGGARVGPLSPSRVKVRGGNVDALQALDLLTGLDLQALTDADRARLSTFLSRVPAGSLLHSACCFPAKTSKKLLEAEALGLLG